MMKTGTKMFSLLLLLAMMLCLWTGAAWAAEGILEGEGTIDSPYLIADKADLEAFRDKVNSGERAICAKLTADIDLNGEEWKPIGGNDGYATSYYGGHFDGGGHTIANFQINAAYNYAGFFSYVKESAAITDLQIKNATISSSKNNVGGLAGTIIDGVIENCSFDGTVTNTKSSNDYAGGIAGYVSNTKTPAPMITGCVNYGTISASYAGGITGYAKYAEITNCYNEGTIAGLTRTGGIAGQIMNNTLVKNCCNVGEMKGTSIGGITGWNGASMENCYWTQPEAGSGAGTLGTATDCAKVETTEGLADKLGAAFTTDANGNVILKWQASGSGQSQPATPSISISPTNGNTLWVQQGDNHCNNTTLQVDYHNMGEETPDVRWSIENTEAATGQRAKNNSDYIVTAQKGGVATVTAAVEYGGETYTAAYKITVIPQFTTAEIKNINEDYPGNIAVGQTVKAIANTTDGVFDPAEYQGLKLSYQWYRCPSGGSFAPISEATEETYTITKAFNEWDDIGVEIKCNGQTVHSYQAQPKDVRSADYGKLYPIAYDDTLVNLPTDVKESCKLDLPASVSKNGITATIEWSGFNGIIAADGKVTLPDTGKTEVTLEGKFTYLDAFCNNDFTITVWSQAAAEEDAKDKQKALKQAAASLGDYYTMYPVYGKDSNVCGVLQTALAAKGYEDIGVSVKSVEEVYGGAGIAPDGGITYFYADPNNMPSIKHGSYKVSFTLEKDGVTLDYADVPVILYWDADMVKAAMTKGILDKVTLDTENPLRGNISLPKVIDGKKWTLIDWQSSDDGVISISKENQTTADTLFDPYVGVVKQGQTAQTVTLTASFTFQLTNDMTGREEPIVLYKTFEVTVEPLDEMQVEQIQTELLAKLDQGFAAKGLRDAVTGRSLVADENGVYKVSNDIQLPVTRDFGVDGKYYPITITSSNMIAAKAPDVANAARVEIYRPGVGKDDAIATITVTIQDKDTSVKASRSFDIQVAALTQEEVEKELALMEQVKAAYFEGLKGKNAARDDIRTDLTPFQEVYADENGNLVWVRNQEDRVGYGIVPTPIQGWQDLELWRLFKSSNPNVISHEDLQVSRQAEAKAVTVTSYLSSETLGRYGELYANDPAAYSEYADLAGLWYQEVSTDATPQPVARMFGLRAVAADAGATSDTMVVRGTKNPDSAVPVVETIDVSFSLLGLDGEEWIAPCTLTDLEEASTVYDVFTRMLTDNGATATRQKGTYIISISGAKGTLAEKEYGERSGWMYRVNGKIPDVYMGACPLRNGDVIQVFYTRDAKKDDPNWTWSMGSGAGSFSGSSSANKEAILVEKGEEDGAYVVTLPQSSGEGQRVAIAAGQEGQLAVLVHADGSQEVIRKSVVTDGKAKFFLAEDAVVKFVDYEHTFADVSKEAWYDEAISFVAGRELFSGVEENRFAPEATLSRGMLITALYRLEQPQIQTLNLPFADVAAGAWYEKAAIWGNTTGVVHGEEGGVFRPDDAVTREELAVMLFRYGKMCNLSTGGRDSLTSFADKTDISDWAMDAVAWAADSGIINGSTDGRIAPGETATRAEAAAMLQRFVEFMMK